MNPLDRLSEYLRSIEKRLRVLAWTRGAAIAAGAALISTVILVMIANAYAFSPSSLLASRTALFLALALALGAGLLLPLLPGRILVLLLLDTVLLSHFEPPQ